MLPTSSRQPGLLSRQAAVSPAMPPPRMTTRRPALIRATLPGRPAAVGRTPPGSGPEDLRRPEVLLHAQPAADVAGQELVEHARPPERGILEVDPLHELGPVTTALEPLDEGVPLVLDQPVDGVGELVRDEAGIVVH